MSAPDLSAEAMAQFRESGAEKHITLLLGAGASLASGPPDWDELVKRLLISSGVVADGTQAGLLLERQDPLIVVEAAHRRFGTTWEQKVTQALYENVHAFEPSTLHRAAAGLALAKEPGAISLATLNFDTLLEAALGEGHDAEIASITDGAEQSSLYGVHHLHGVVSPTGTRDLVLTLTDFLNVVGDPGSWQSAFLEQALHKGAVVIAGTSYRDPDVRQWLHVARASAPAEHAAIVLLAREGFKLSRDEFEALRIALSEQWVAVGLRPVLLQDHSEAAQVIAELPSVNEPGYLSPRERAQMLWRAHQDRFDELQQEYVQALKRDSELLRPVLDVEQLNVTLWLSDGEGGLARWAAEDRVYQDRDGLRVVETGFDSPWIAGKALAIDALLIKDTPADGLGRWQSVLAVPIPVPHSQWPTMSAAVLTVGLPESAASYDKSAMLWTSMITEVADTWSVRLSSNAF